MGKFLRAVWDWLAGTGRPRSTATCCGAVSLSDLERRLRVVQNGSFQRRDGLRRLWL